MLLIEHADRLTIRKRFIPSEVKETALTQSRYMSVFNLHCSKIKLFLEKTAGNHKVSLNKNLKPDKCDRYSVIPPFCH